MNEELLRRSYERLLVIREQEANRALCPAVEEIQALVSRQGDEASRLLRLDHVMQCSDCRKEFDLLRSLELARPRDPAGNWRLWAFAATIVLVAGATVVWRMIQPRPDVLRGASGQVTLIGPPEQEVVRLPATLVWNAVPGALSYRVELLDGAGATTWSSEATDTTLQLENMPIGEVERWRVVAEFLDGVPLESAERSLRLQPKAPTE